MRALSRRDGTWTAAFRHRAYGVALDSAGSVPFELRYRWIGREFDEETGLYYLRARYYDPNSQRFTQEDPIGFGGGSNVYAYGDGNPTNGRDLNGLTKDFEYGAMASMDPSNPFAGCTGTWDGCGGGGGSNWWAPLDAWADAFIRSLKKGPLGDKNEGGPVFFGGVGGCNVAAAGLCASSGVVVGATRGRLGAYRSWGVAAGIDVGVGIEFGYMSSRRGFVGASRVSCLGACLFSVCRLSNDAGSGWSLSIGAGFDFTAVTGETYTTVYETRYVFSPYIPAGFSCGGWFQWCTR